MRVQEVALVLRDLARRVEGVARPAAVVDGHAVGDVRAADLGPLLELDDDGGVAPRVGFEPVIRTSRRLERERQLELDEDALVGQVGELEDVRHRAERVAPGRDLGRRRPVAELVEEAIGELVREARLGGVGDELLGRALVEVQPLPSPGRRWVCADSTGVYVTGVWARTLRSWSRLRTSSLPLLHCE